MSGISGRAKCSISRNDLQNVMKYTIEEPVRDYLEGTTDTIIKSYKKFFQRVAPETDRLNHNAVSACARDLFGLGSHDALMFGTALTKAFSDMKQKGDKALTGGRLSPAVKDIYLLLPRSRSWKSMGESAEASLRKEQSEVKAEGEDDENLEVKAELLHKTPERKLKQEISDVILDPAEIYRMYQARPTIKLEQVAHRLACVCMYMSRI